MLNYKSYGDLARDVAANLQKIPRTDIVVGVPKSGLVPAVMVASLKNARFSDLDSFLFSFASRSGMRKYEDSKVSKTRVLIVDDSVNTGAEFRRVRKRVEHMWQDFDFTFCAIYGRDQSQADHEADVVLTHVPQPRIFQWNYRNHIIAEHALFDMDGVLCVDPTDEQNDDGEAYIDFILNAEPLVIPVKTISAIVTSRLEKYRTHTEEWLKNNGVRYKELIMLDLPSAEERRRLRAHAPFKAEVYNNREEFLFVESNWKQAQTIALEADKAVLCTENDVMLFGREHLATLEKNARLPSQDSLNLQVDLQHKIQQLVQRLVVTDPYAATWLSKSGLKIDYSNIGGLSPFHKTQLVSASISSNLSNDVKPLPIARKPGAKKKLLMISTAFNVSKGAGAAASSSRLRDCLVAEGHDVHTLSLEDFPELARYSVDQPSSGTNSGMWINFANGQHSTRLKKRVSAINPDCIVLGAVDRGILSMFDIATLPYPIVWINRDNWAHTGGCLFKLPQDEVKVTPETSQAYLPSLTCDGYKTGCSQCPALTDVRESGKTRTAYEIKRATLSYRKDIVFAPISSWLAGMMKNAPLTREHSIVAINNPIDLSKVTKLAHRPSSIRDDLGLSPDKRLVLLAAHSLANPRKGLKLALDALSSDERFVDCNFVTMGAERPEKKTMPNGTTVHSLGFIDNEEAKVSIYNEVDVTLLPALQESLSVVGSDSICCGTPVVAFNTSGITTFAKHKQTGYLARAFDVEDLLNGLHWVLTEADCQILSENCLRTAQALFDAKTNISSLVAAIDQATLNFAQLGELPAELDILNKAMVLTHEDNKFRWQDLRFRKNKIDELQKLKSMPPADIINEIFSLRNKLDWNRKKRVQLEEQVSELKEVNQTLEAEKLDAKQSVWSKFRS